MRNGITKKESKQLGKRCFEITIQTWQFIIIIDTVEWSSNVYVGVIDPTKKLLDQTNCMPPFSDQGLVA
jgi:hypothetical protein